jgi:uncharacterized small protein (DUF1192 family)
MRRRTSVAEIDKQLKQLQQEVQEAKAAQDKAAFTQSGSAALQE